MNTNTDILLKLIIAILLPPLAVAIERGLKWHFLLSIVLWLLAWLPGVIHAIYIVFKSNNTIIK